MILKGDVEISANGNSSKNQNGAGSGGSIQFYVGEALFSDSGNVRIEARGGSVHIENEKDIDQVFFGGPGGGGRIGIVFYLWPFRKSNKTTQIDVNTSGGIFIPPSYFSSMDQNTHEWFLGASGGSKRNFFDIFMLTTRVQAKQVGLSLHVLLVSMEFLVRNAPKDIRSRFLATQSAKSAKPFRNKPSRNCQTTAGSSHASRTGYSTPKKSTPTV